MEKLTAKAPGVARVVLGLIFTVFGLNFFVHFLPMPAPPPAAGAFFGALYATGYMLPLLKAIEVFAGVLLLSSRLVPFALTLLAPIVVNIVGFHVFLAPQGLPVALLTLVLGIYLAWHEREAYRPLFAGQHAGSTRASRKHGVGQALGAT